MTDKACKIIKALELLFEECSADDSEDDWTYGYLRGVYNALEEARKVYYGEV